MGSHWSREKGMGKGNHSNCCYGWTSGPETWQWPSGAGSIAQHWPQPWGHQYRGHRDPSRVHVTLPLVPSTPLCQGPELHGARAPLREPPCWDVVVFGGPMEGLGCQSWGMWGEVPALCLLMSAGLDVHTSTWR